MRERGPNNRSLIPADAVLYGTSTSARNEAALIHALRRREEAAFSTLVGKYHPALLRLARSFVNSEALAEEIVQDTWMGVLRGLNRFESRSSLKTWIFRILVNRARTCAQREQCCVPFSALYARELDSGEAAVPAERFLETTHEQWPGHWAVPPSSWGENAEDRLLSEESVDLIQSTIGTLPPVQQQVITLRDVEGWNSEEVCHVLEISETNQRVLLHRARSKVRQALESYFAKG